MISRIWFVFLVLAFGGSACFAVWVASLDNAMVAAENVFDAEPRSPGAVVTHKYIVANRSLQRMCITSVTPSCSCDTEAEATHSELAWLDETEVTVKWRIPDKTGTAETSIVVGYTSEAGPGTVVLTMRCVVSRPESLGTVR